MNIVFKKKRKNLFEDLEVGELFIDLENDDNDEVVFLKINEECCREINAVSLNSGFGCCFRDDEKVELVKGELIIK